MTDTQNLTVADLMIPINEYPTLSADASLKDAFKLLSRRPVEAGNFGFRRVLVLENDGRIKGILTIPLLLKGMEPALLATSPGEAAQGYWAQLDVREGMALEVFWDEVLKSPRQDLAEAPIGDLVTLPGKLVTPETSLARALAYLLAEEAPMLPVEEGGTVVAVVRLVDIFKVITQKILGAHE